MKLPLRINLLVSFIAVILTTSLFATFIGVKLIGKSIVPRVQDKVRLDLNSAREMFRGTQNHIEDIVRLTASRFFVKDALSLKTIDTFAATLEDIRKTEALDFLAITDAEGNVILRTRNPDQRGDNLASNPVIQKAILNKISVVSAEVLSPEELETEAKGLAAQARMKIIPTSHAGPDGGDDGTGGLVILAAAPVLGEQDRLLGVLYGGKLLNRDRELVDRIRDTIFENEKYHGKNVGVATIYRGHLRVASNLMTDGGQSAVGTLAADDVATQVLDKGNTWGKRGFFVSDWYIAAYTPIRNLSGKIIGMLGIGMLERRFTDMENQALLVFLVITLVGAVVAIVLCWFFINVIVKPIHTLTAATHDLAQGALDRRVQLSTAPPEIAALGHAFNMMAASLQQKDEQLKRQAQEEIMKSDRLAMIGRLSAGVAHEINNPLGSILLFSRLLLQKAPPDGLFKENLERIEKDTKRCQNIVQGLLDFARQREPRIESIDVNDLAEKTLRLFENQPMLHNIQVIRQYAPELPIVPADPGQILQVFVNIVMNAVDAMRGKGALTISTRYRPQDDSVEISFNDTGCGMSAEILDRIFEPFFTTKGVGQGTGLGLSISYGVVQRHGGTIQAVSEVGKGSTFTIVLPKTRTKV